MNKLDWVLCKGWSAKCSKNLGQSPRYSLRISSSLTCTYFDMIEVPIMKTVSSPCIVPTRLILMIELPAKWVNVLLSHINDISIHFPKHSNFSLDVQIEREEVLWICHTFWSHDAVLTNHKTGIDHELGIYKFSSHKEGEEKSWHITQVNNSPP